MLSQNAAFVGTADPHEDDSWAPGHSLALLLRDRLTAGGWEVSEPDVWRGSGWFLECRRGEERTELNLAAATDAGWTVQVVPSYIPGWLGRLRGKVTSATPASVHALARAVHAAIVSEGAYSGLRWCWDGDPWKASTAVEPPLPTQPS